MQLRISGSFAQLIVPYQNRSYLCWTMSPEISSVIEYSPEAVSEESIFRMAESVPVS